MPANHPRASRLNAVYPLVTTNALAATRDFYVRHFGFAVGFEASWFVWLARRDDSGGEIALAFMTPDHPSRPPGPESFDGKGLILTFQVPDAAAEAARLRAEGVALAYPPTDEPWGQRRFQVVDPAGMTLDIVEQTEPRPGYWDRYKAVAA